MIALALLLAAVTCTSERAPLEGLPLNIRSRFGALEVLKPCRVSDFPADARGVLTRYFGTSTLAEAMASPDEKWNSSCFGMPGVAPRQLRLAAHSGPMWVVHFWVGGFGLSDQVVVFTTAAPEPAVVFAGYCSPADFDIDSAGEPRSIGPWRCEAWSR